MKSTLTEQIRKLYFVGFLIIILISTISFAFFSSVIYKKQTQEFSQEILKLNIDLLDGKLIEIRESQKAIVNDSGVREILKYREENKDLDYSIELYNQRTVMERFNLLLNNLKLDNAYIVNGEGEIYYSYKESFKSRSISDRRWFREIVDTAILGTSYISKVHENDYTFTQNKKQYISVVMPFSRFDTLPQEYLICDLPLDSFLKENIYDGINFAFVDGDGRCYLFKDGKIKELNIKNLKSWRRIEEMISKSIYDGEEIMINSTVSKLFGLEILGIKQLNEISRMNYKIGQIFLLILALAVFLSSFISRKISDIITAPVKRLIKNCKMVSTGNYSVKFEEEENYEVNLLSQVIENMIGNIVFLNNKIVEEEKKMVEEKIRTLQHQINPHFINNILQSIKSLAISGENQKISNMTTLLGKIMAYSVYQPHNTVTIKDELEHIKNYLEIQNIRFDNKIRYFIDCEPGLERTEVMKLTLQPLLENSIEHGIKSLERGMISISVEKEKDSICIIINDNGLGVDLEKLEEIQENLRSGKVYNNERSIGVLNVNERLQRKYGNDYGVEFISKKDVGTTVIVKIPKVVRGEK